MLIPNTIPDKEPLLRVGIVLPEDNFSSITLEIPEETNYQLVTLDKVILLFAEQSLTFQIENSNIICSVDSSSYTHYRIEPIETYTINSGFGIKVNKVIAGRGFHWEKYIDVILPGCVELKNHQGKIVVTNELPLEEYLMCVATSEMGAACPSALIESQTIAARSWMLANIEQKHVDLELDVCNDDCCQRYQGSKNLTEQSITGAKNTTGLVLLHDRKICDARYSKSCGGIMESFTVIWGGEDIPYLQNIFDTGVVIKDSEIPLSDESAVKNWIDDRPDVFCSSLTVPEDTLPNYLGSVDEKGTYFRWKITYSQNEIVELLNNKLKLNSSRILELKPIKRGGSGRLSKLEIIYIDIHQHKKSILVDSEYKIRQALHPGFLYSSCFYTIIEKNESDHPIKFTFKGAGWGHGVGYCQIGALGMSLNGYDTKQILAHYYPGSILTKIY